MKTITATGYNNGTFIYNVLDDSWDFEDNVDTTLPRYAASRKDLQAAHTAAEGTLLQGITFNNDTTLHLRIEEEVTSTEQLAGLLEDIAIQLRRGKTRSFKPQWVLEEREPETTSNTTAS